MRIAIIEDERAETAKALDILGTTENGNFRNLVLRNFTDAEDYRSAIAAGERFDVLFFDVTTCGTLEQANMLSSLTPGITLVFVSSDTSRFRDVYKVPHAYFLTVPIERSSLRDCIYRIRKNYASKRVLLEKYGAMHIVELDKVAFMESILRKTVLHYTDGTKEEFPVNMKEVESLITLPSFVRVHKSFIINLERASSVERTRVCFGGEDGTEKTLINVSRPYIGLLKSRNEAYMQSRRSELADNGVISDTVNTTVSVCPDLFSSVVNNIYSKPENDPRGGSAGIVNGEFYGFTATRIVPSGNVDQILKLEGHGKYPVNDSIISGTRKIDLGVYKYLAVRYYYEVTHPGEPSASYMTFVPSPNDRLKVNRDFKRFRLGSMNKLTANRWSFAVFSFDNISVGGKYNTEHFHLQPFGTTLRCTEIPDGEAMILEGLYFAATPKALQNVIGNEKFPFPDVTGTAKGVTHDLIMAVGEKKRLFAEACISTTGDTGGVFRANDALIWHLGYHNVTASGNPKCVVEYCRPDAEILATSEGMTKIHLTLAAKPELDLAECRVWVFDKLPPEGSAERSMIRLPE